MSGHSKWANIKHKKDAVDRKKGKVFSRVTKEIIVAVKRGGGGDQNANPALRNALISARSVNMPNANIERAIKKALGEQEGVNYEEITYEGYAAGGVAILVDILTDSRNRTASEIRMIFDRNNGSLAGSGAVTWMFKRKARFMITGKDADEERLMEITLDAGADNIEVEDGIAEVWGDFESFVSISDALQKAGIQPEESGIVKVPENYIDIKDVRIARQVLNLIEKIEDNDDVQAVYNNMDISKEIISELEKED